MDTSLSSPSTGWEFGWLTTLPVHCSQVSQKDKRHLLFQSNFCIRLFFLLTVTLFFQESHVHNGSTIVSANDNIMIYEPHI